MRRFSPTPKATGSRRFKVLDPKRTQTVCNGDWFKKMSFAEVIRLNSRVTLQQMLQREDFKERVEQTTTDPGP